MGRRAAGAVLLFVLTLYVCRSAAEEEGELWRALADDEGVPPGAHVRLNITSLEKTVRVDGQGNIVRLDRAPEGDTDPAGEATAVAELPEIDGGAADEARRASREMMRRSLLKLPSEELGRFGISLEDLTGGGWEDLVEPVWAQRQASLDEAMAQMAEHVDILGERVRTLADPASSEEALLGVLALLEDDLMDIDMARDFRTIGGWAQLVRLLRPGASPALRSAAALVIGNAVRNTDEYRGWVVTDALPAEAGGESVAAMDLLLSMVASEAATDAERQRALSALSAALYGHADNVEALVARGGAGTLLRILEGANAKMARRVATWLHDLAFEVAESRSERLTAALEQVLRAGDWCGALVRALEGEGAGGPRVAQLAEALREAATQLRRAPAFGEACGGAKLARLRQLAP